MVTCNRVFKDIPSIRIVKVDGVFAGQVFKRSFGKYRWTANPANRTAISDEFRTMKAAVNYLADGLTKGFE